MKYEIMIYKETNKLLERNQTPNFIKMIGYSTRCHFENYVS